MAQLREDIAQAESRMRRTFGTRSAIRNLHESLESGELVQTMLACLYSNGDGLLVLTDRRVLAVRDDFSKFRLQAIALIEVRALDYAPTVHDGLAVLTDTGRIAVRKMERTDSDAFAAALVERVPSIIVGASRPQTREPFRGEPAHPTGSADRAAPAAGSTSGAADGAPASSPAQVADEQAHAATQAVAATAAASPAPGSVGAAGAPGAPGAPGADGGGPGGADEGVGAGGAVAAGTAAPDADKEVLLGVLADLHAKGLLTAEELATKIAQVADAP